MTSEEKTIVQKFELIMEQTMLHMNFENNLAWLIQLNGQLNKRIVMETILGNKTIGFVELRNEISEWIKILAPLVVKHD